MSRGIASWLLVALAVGLSTLPAYALLVAVYSRDGSVTEADRESIAVALRHGLLPSLPSGVTCAMKDSAILTGDLSVLPGVAAYFWSNAPLILRPEFRMEGAPMLFEYEPPSQAPLAKGTAALPLTWSTALTSASWRGSTVAIAYSLAEPGRVHVEAIGADGRVFGRWSWPEESGMHAKSLELNGAPPAGPLMLRWTLGPQRILRTLSPGR